MIAEQGLLFHHWFINMPSKQYKNTGAILVELTIVLPLITFLTLASLEFSHAISEYKSLVIQVRNATRYLSVSAPGSSNNLAICMVKTGAATSNCSTNWILPGFADGTASITVRDSLNQPSTHRSQKTSGNTSEEHGVTVNLVTVEVSNYPYHTMIGSFGLGSFVIPEQIKFGKISTTMRQVN